MSTSAPPPTAPPTRQAAPTSSPGALSHRQILTILSGLMLGMLLAALDQTIVATSIRTIADDLHGLSQQAWATTAYLITSTIATPLYGKLSDLHGRKPYFLIAISIFIAGSAMCTFSTSMDELAAFRAFQGLGAGGLMSLALAILGDIVPPRERARYQAYLLGVFATSSVLGPLVGGFLAGQSTLLGIAGWRWVFLVNVPIGIIALFVVARVLNIPHTRREHRIDVWGAVTIAIAVVPMLIVAEEGRGWGWGSARSLICYGISLIGLVAWILVERWIGEDALIPMRLFRNATFSQTSLLAALIGVGMFGGLLLIPQYLQIVKGASPTDSGLEMLPLMVGMIVGSILSGQITAKTGRYKVFPVIGTAMIVAAMLLFAYRVQWDTPMWQTMCYMVVFGWGLGFCMQTLVLAVQNAVPPRDMGVATASSTFFRQMGATAGTAVFLSVLFSSVSSKIASSFKAAVHTPAFQAALANPSVVGDPANKPVVDLLQHGGSGASSGVLSDSSFIQKLDPVFAAPFKQGFADSMQSVFLLGTFVMVAAFLLMLFIKEVPLRQVSGLEAQAAEESGAARAAAADPADTLVEPEPAVGPASAVMEAVPLSAMAVAPPVVDGLGPVVRGLVLDGDGTPLPGAVVTLIDVTGSQLDRTVSDEEGRYRVAAPVGGTYVLIGSAGFRQPQAATVVVGGSPADLDLTLSGAVGLAGAVLDAEKGHGLSGALVVATDVRGEVVATTQAGPNGGFMFAALVPGGYTLAVSADGHRPAAVSAEVANGRKNWYEILLSAGARITGTVRGTDGRPLDDARVTLFDPAGNVVGTATTGADGEYGFIDLDGGDYTVIASGYAPVAASLRLDGDGRDDFDIDLSHDAAG